MRRKTMNVLAAVAGAVVLTACGDSRLDHLAIGMAKDSVAAAMGTTAHRDLNFLTAGRQWNLQLFSRSDVAPADSVAWRKMSPVVAVNGKVVGWGWKWWGPKATAQKISMPGE